MVHACDHVCHHTPIASDIAIPYELRIMCAKEPPPEGRKMVFLRSPRSIPLGTGQPGQQIWGKSITWGWDPYFVIRHWY